MERYLHDAGFTASHAGESRKSDEALEVLAEHCHSLSLAVVELWRARAHFAKVSKLLSRSGLRSSSSRTCCNAQYPHNRHAQRRLYVLSQKAVFALAQTVELCQDMHVKR